MSVFVLGDCFVIIVVFLIDEGDGNGGGGVEHLSVGDASIPVTEYDCSWGDDLGFSSPGRLRILTRPTREEVGSVDDVGDVLGKRVVFGPGEEIGQ